MERDKALLTSHGITYQLKVQLSKVLTAAQVATALIEKRQPETIVVRVKPTGHCLSGTLQIGKREHKIPPKQIKGFSSKGKSDKKLLISNGIMSHARIHIGRLEVQINQINTIGSGNVRKPSYKKRVRGKNQVHKCPIGACDVELSMGFLKSHLVAKHTSKKVFKCAFSKCDFSTSVSHFLKTHLATAHHQLPFHCSVCPKKCKTFSHLRSHMLSHSPPESKQNVCLRPNCEFASHYAADLKMHSKSHDLDLNYKCPHCSWKTKYEKSIAVHVEKTHANSNIPKPFKCPHDQCNFAADKLSKIKLHSRVHSDDKPFKCHLCKFSTKHRNSIRTHLVMHAGLKPFECNLCGKKMRTSTHLQDHLRRHLGEKPFKCPELECDFVAATRTEIKSHGYEHHSEDGRAKIKCFKCPLCLKAFHRKKHLSSHIKTHTLEKPFRCQFCKREFGTNGSKIKHEMCCRMRPGEKLKPYTCEFCEHRFGSTSHKLLHEMTCKFRPDGRSIQPFKCPIAGCSFAATQKSNLKYHTNKFH